MDVGSAEYKALLRFSTHNQLSTACSRMTMLAGPHSRRQRRMSTSQGLR